MDNKKDVKVISYTTQPATAESADKYYDIIADLRYAANEIIDTLRQLENYMDLNDALNDAIETDFNRLEKLSQESKNIIKRLNKKKVVVRR